MLWKYRDRNLLKQLHAVNCQQWSNCPPRVPCSQLLAGTALAVSSSPCESTLGWAAVGFASLGQGTAICQTWPHETPESVMGERTLPTHSRFSWDSSKQLCKIENTQNRHSHTLGSFQGSRWSSKVLLGQKLPEHSRRLLLWPLVQIRATQLCWFS